MKWIRVASNVADDAKVWRIAELTGVDAFKVLGHLVTLWGVMSDQAKDGDLSPFPDSRLEMWAKWTGKRGRFAAAVRGVLCDERGVMTAWEKYQGAAIREHEADARRAAERRRTAKDQPDGPPNSPADYRADRPAESPPLRDETRRDVQDPPPASQSGRVVALVEVADDAVRPRLPADYRPDFDALLAAIVPDRRAAWLRTMAAKLSGLHPPQVSPVALGEAIRAMLGNGAELSLRLFEGYVRRAAQPPPSRAAPVVQNGRLSAGAQSEANSLRGVALLLGEDTTEDAP